MLLENPALEIAMFPPADEDVNVSPQLIKIKLTVGHRSSDSCAELDEGEKARLLLGAHSTVSLFAY